MDIIRYYLSATEMFKYILPFFGEKHGQGRKKLARFKKNILVRIGLLRATEK